MGNSRLIESFSLAAHSDGIENLLVARHPTDSLRNQTTLKSFSLINTKRLYLTFYKSYERIITKSNFDVICFCLVLDLFTFEYTVFFFPNKMCFLSSAFLCRLKLTEYFCYPLMSRLFLFFKKRFYPRINVLIPIAKFSIEIDRSDTSSNLY